MKKLLLTLTVFILVSAGVYAQTNNVQLKEMSTGKSVLVEFFSSPSCPYCAQYVPVLESVVNKDKAFTIALMYPTYGPSPDIFYNTDNETNINTRFDFYGITNVPVHFEDGVQGDVNHNGLFNGSDVDLKTDNAKPTVIQIDNPTAKLTGNALTCSATAHAIQAVTGDIRGFIAVTEEQISFTSPPGTNGQKVFNWVLRKMLPNGAGTILGSSLAIGATKAFSGSWTLTSNIYNKSQIRIVYFVQNMTTKEVYWTSKVSTTTTDIEENNNLNIESIYPNPASDIANVSFNLIKPEKVSLRVYDIIGKTVLNRDLCLMSVGNNHFTLDVDNLNTGIYFVELNSGNGKSIKKISVIR